MRLPFTALIRDDDLDVELPEIECSIIVSSELDCGFRHFYIDAVLVDEKDIFRSDDMLFRRIAAAIANEAEGQMNTSGSPLRERALAREAA